MSYLLDTNTCIGHLTGRAPQVTDQHSSTDVGIPGSLDSVARSLQQAGKVTMTHQPSRQCSLQPQLEGRASVKRHFLAPSLHLIVEVDGLWRHRRIALDERRDRKLTFLDARVQDGQLRKVYGPLPAWIAESISELPNHREFVGLRTKQP